MSDPLTLLVLAAAMAPAAPSVPPDVQASVTWKVSRAHTGGETDGYTTPVDVTADGSEILVFSEATNLVAGDTNGVMDVFVLDATTGAAERVSVWTGGVQGNGESREADMSPDGRWVVFSTWSTNWDVRDTNNYADVYLRDRVLGTTTLVSLNGTGTTAIEGYRPAVSDDGTIIAFETHTSLDPGDTNSHEDIYVRDLGTGAYTLASRNAAGQAGDGLSYAATMSGDGTGVAFVSFATNLDGADANGFADVYHHDVALGVTDRVSFASGGGDTNQRSDFPRYARAGDFIAYTCYATNLTSVPRTVGSGDVAVYEVATGTNEWVSLRSDGSEAVGSSFISGISPDGRIVAFDSTDDDIAPGAAFVRSTAVHDRDSGITTVASVTDLGEPNDAAAFGWTAISADGRYVAFSSTATNLGAGSNNGIEDVYVHDRRSTGPALTVAPLAGGLTATLQVTGATPNGTLIIGYSLAGQGLIPTAYGMIHLAQPVQTFSLTADAAGNASTSRGVPQSLTGFELWFQGVDPAAGMPTTVFRDTVL